MFRIVCLYFVGPCFHKQFFSFGHCITDILCVKLNLSVCLSVCLCVCLSVSLVFIHSRNFERIWTKVVMWHPYTLRMVMVC